MLISCFRSMRKLVRASQMLMIMSNGHSHIARRVGLSTALMGIILQRAEYILGKFWVDAAKTYILKPK